MTFKSTTCMHSHNNRRAVLERHIWAQTFVSEGSVPRVVEQCDVVLSKDRWVPGSQIRLDAFRNTCAVHSRITFWASTSINSPDFGKALAVDPTHHVLGPHGSLGLLWKTVPKATVAKLGAWWSSECFLPGQRRSSAITVATILWI